MRKTALIIALSALGLVGCATQDYRLYAETQKSIANANAMAEAARWQALGEIAKTGDTTARVAAVMALQSGGNGGGNRQAQSQVAPPKSATEIALAWTGLLLPNFTQLYGINRNAVVAMRQSDNATQLGLRQSDNQANVTMQTNTTFGNMASAGLNTANSIAGLGFTATSNVANTGLSTVANVAGAGLSSVVSVANNGSNNMANVSTASSAAAASTATANSNAVISLSNAIANVQPNITTTTTSTTNNTTTNNNLTCPAGQTLVNGSCVAP